MTSVLVVYDDGASICCPMTADFSCEGALCCGLGPVVLFPDRKQARRAIQISKTFARLCELQGKIANTDFLGDPKHIKIVNVEAPAAVVSGS